jgi:bacteriorhodopsin
MGLVIQRQKFLEGKTMNKFRTVVSVITMIIAGIIGFFIGVSLNEPMGGAILFSMIDGFACVIYALDNREE